MTNLVNTEDITKKFAESLVLVRLSFSKFGTEKTDKQKSKEFRTNNGVTVENAARVVKKLMPNCKSIQDVDSHDKATTNRLKRWGAPYAKGVYMIPATKFLEATSQLRKDLADRVPLIHACGEVYNLSVELAKNTLGTSFDPKDYPTHEEFLASFSHDFDVIPVANPSQLNLAVVGEASEAIQVAVNETYAEKIATLAPHIRSVLLEPLMVLSKACQRFLDDPKKSRAHDSLFENVHAAAAQAKGLNIFGDELVDNATYHIEQTIPKFSGNIKDDTHLCQRVLSDCNTVIEMLEGSVPVEPCDPFAQVTFANEPESSLPETPVEPCDPAPVISCTDLNVAEEPEPTDEQIHAEADKAPEPSSDDILAKLGW